MLHIFLISKTRANGTPLIKVFDVDNVYSSGSQPFFIRGTLVHLTTAKTLATCLDIQLG